jgi:hypothetical protein
MRSSGGLSRAHIGANSGESAPSSRRGSSSDVSPDMVRIPYAPFFRARLRRVRIVERDRRATDALNAWVVALPVALPSRGAPA